MPTFVTNLWLLKLLEGRDWLVPKFVTSLLLVKLLKNRAHSILSFQYSGKSHFVIRTFWLNSCLAKALLPYLIQQFGLWFSIWKIYCWRHKMSLTSDFLHLSRNRYVYFRNRASKIGMLHWTWWLLTLALQCGLYGVLQENFMPHAISACMTSWNYTIIVMHSWAYKRNEKFRF